MTPKPRPPKTMLAPKGKRKRLLMQQPQKAEAAIAPRNQRFLADATCHAGVTERYVELSKVPRHGTVMWRIDVGALVDGEPQKYQLYLRQDSMHEVVDMYFNMNGTLATEMTFTIEDKRRRKRKPQRVRK